MGESDHNNRNLLYLIVGAIALLLLLRMLMVFRFVFFAVLVIAGAGYGVYRLFRWLEERNLQKKMAQRPEGIMTARIEHCRQQIARNKEEIEDIRTNIRQLEDQLVATINISESTKEETRQVIREFQSELKLRQSKLAFFTTCQKKLEGLRNNYLLSSELEAKKRKLKELKEENYEDMASMEELKSEVEMDVLYLDTIEDLSRRILASTNFDDADHLRLELEEMTRDLDEFEDTV